MDVLSTYGPSLIDCITISIAAKDNPQLNSFDQNMKLAIPTDAFNLLLFSQLEN